MVLPERIIIWLLLLSVSTLTNNSGSAGGRFGGELVGNFGYEILFSDDFSQTNTGWDRYENDYLNVDYDDGFYRIEISDPSVIVWGIPYLDFTDVIIEVEAYKASGGDDNGYGIICRHQDSENFYLFEVIFHDCQTLRV